MTDMNQHDTLQGIPAPMARAIAFIWKEAELLDKKDYAAWQALWTEDGYYVVPIDPDTTGHEAGRQPVHRNTFYEPIKVWESATAAGDPSAGASPVLEKNLATA